MLKEYSAELFRSWPASSTNPVSKQLYQTIVVKPVWFPFIRKERNTTRQITGQFVWRVYVVKSYIEHILVSKLMQHLSEHDRSLLVASRHGFHNGMSCETQLVQFIHDLCKNLDGAHKRGPKQTDLSIIKIMDFAKAFDKVSHRRL